jgi:hypothetical protein
MIVTVSPGILKLPPPKTMRGEGVHVSGIIRCIALETGILTAGIADELDLLEVKPNQRFADPMVCLRICIGLAWEEWYIPQLPEVMDHPGEMSRSEIYMNHDGEELTTILVDRGTFNRLIIHEVKATYKSIRGVGLTAEGLALIKEAYPNVKLPDVGLISPLRDQWMWLAQVKAYCKAAITRFARIHVLFICGDYSYPIQPVLLVYDVEFTQQEVDDNWDLLVDYRDIRIEIERRQLEGL